MAQMPPHYSEQDLGNTLDYHVSPPLRTSGMAIASLACGIVGLVTCCLLIPSVVAVVFGAVALAPIKRQEVKGRELAIAGIITGALGLLVGLALIIAAVLSPETYPVTSAEISESEHAMLIAMGVVEDDDDIELLYSDGMLSIREGGVVLTTRRLIVYFGEGTVEACNLVDIAAIIFEAGSGWLEDGSFIIELDDGQEISFTISSMDAGDSMFERRLRKGVTTLREQAARSTPRETLAPLGQGAED